jgi:hypothetical protein
MRRICFALAAAVAMVVSAHADVYKTVDAQGQAHYSDQWSPGAELVKGVSHATSEASPPAPAAAPSGGDPAPSSETAKKVQADVSAARAEQCKGLKEQYEKMVRARRIYQASDSSAPAPADAPKQYLSEAQADAERVKARQAMDEACGSGN